MTEKQQKLICKKMGLKQIYGKKYRAFLVAQLVKNPPAMQETWFDFRVGNFPWRRDRLPTPDSLDKEMATSSSILAWEIPRTEGACQAAVCGVTKESDTT